MSCCVLVFVMAAFSCHHGSSVVAMAVLSSCCCCHGNGVIVLLLAACGVVMGACVLVVMAACVVMAGCGVVMEHVPSSSWQCVCACGERLHQLMTQTLTEAVEDEQQQRGRNQADQDHTQPQLTNHQQVNPQRQRAEVHLSKHTTTPHQIHTCQLICLLSFLTVCLYMLLLV